MKILGSFGRMTTGVILMFTGVLLMFVFVALPGITEIMSGNVFANLIIGAILLVIGFGIFTNPIITPKRQKRARIYQKSKHELLEIFGLE